MSVKQRTGIKFCILKGKKQKKTMEMLVKAYGNAAMKRTALHKWYLRHENVNNVAESSGNQRTP